MIPAGEVAWVNEVLSTDPDSEQTLWSATPTTANSHNTVSHIRDVSSPTDEYPCIETKSWILQHWAPSVTPLKDPP